MNSYKGIKLIIGNSYAIVYFINKYNLKIVIGNR